jgi:hypothetical protein
MKELEVKAMLADPNIPNDYKLGGRLDERFLAGVEYAEAATEKAPELWVARDKKNKALIYLYRNKPFRDIESGIFYEEDSDVIELPEEAFPEVTWENSPQKVNIVIK